MTVSDGGNAVLHTDQRRSLNNAQVKRITIITQNLTVGDDLKAQRRRKDA